MNWKKWTIFTRDVAPVVGPPNTANLSNYSNISGYVKLIRLSIIIVPESEANGLRSTVNSNEITLN